MELLLINLNLHELVWAIFYFDQCPPGKDPNWNLNAQKMIVSRRPPEFEIHPRREEYRRICSS
jgi:hypothetical protein